MVLFYQAITLNVAINSHNNALLTLLISNQFVEIKGSVFKKFEKENLFQLSCSDIVERFQLSVFLVIITARNLIQLNASYLNTLMGWSFWPLDERPLYEQISSFGGFILELPLHASSFVIDTLPSQVYSLLVQPFSWNIDIDSYVNIFDALIYPVMIVFGTEMVVDWLKHAFITKFNQIRPIVYSRYLDILCRDLVFGRQTSR
jgi:hypothetical protein